MDTHVPDASADVARPTGGSSDEKQQILPGTRALKAIGFRPGLDILECGLLLKIVELYWQHGPFVFKPEQFTTLLFNDVNLIRMAFESLVKAGVVAVDANGLCCPVEFAKTVESDVRRLDALKEYNQHRVSPKAKTASLTPEIMQQFNEFWKAYPRVKGRTWHKSIALRAFAKAIRTASLNDIMTGLEIAKRSLQWRQNGGMYIPMPSTFLNQRRWEDYIADRHNALANEIGSSQVNDRAAASGKSIIINGKRYTPASPPAREEFRTEREYVEARAKWAVWLAQLG